jgi:hypothetical protein
MVLRSPLLWSVRGSFVTGFVFFALASSTLRADEPFDYFRNSWNVIGLKDYRSGTRVTPDNKLQLAGGCEAELRCGRALMPLSHKHVKTLLEGWMPVVLLSAQGETVRYDIKLWATPLPSVKDWPAAFAWPSETENYLNWITVRAINTGTEPSEARFQVLLSTAKDAPLESFTWRLPPDGAAEGVVRIPFEAVADGKTFADADPQTWLQRTVDYWRGLMAGASRIEVPCRKATEALLAAHVCQLIANDHGELHGGEGFYDEFYIRDGGYQIMELEEAGLKDAAKKAVDVYLRHQRSDGRFESQDKQFDANGQAIWVLW